MSTRIYSSSLATIAAASLTAFLALSSPGDQSGDTVTLTGCLRTGSTAAVLILRGVVPARPADMPDTGGSMTEDYLLVSIPESVDLSGMMNHRVAISGIVSDAKSGPPPPEQANTAERALKRLSVQSAREVAANCAPVDSRR